MKKICAVYRLRHKSGAAYVGGSVDVVARWQWHEYMLDENKHTCRALQRLWNRDGELSFVFEILVHCTRSRLRSVEDQHALREKRLLSQLNVGFKKSAESRRRAGKSRARYLETPGAREALAERARQQHRAGNFGRSTWKTGPRVRSLTPAQRKFHGDILRAHIAAQSSAEMARRARCRRSVQ